MMSGNRALFLDRDGIFNEIVYRDNARGKQMTSARNWNEIRHYDGLEGLPEIKELGFRLLMVTNQPDVERGIITQEFLDSLHGFYREKYALDGVYCCPFSSNDHPLKKPNPGMFLAAAKDFFLNLADCFHLGDTERDVQAAKRCGCKSILWDRPYNQSMRSDFRVSHLWEVRAILATQPKLT